MTEPMRNPTFILRYDSRAATSTFVLGSRLKIRSHLQMGGLFYGIITALLSTGPRLIVYSYQA